MYPQSVSYLFLIMYVITKFAKILRGQRSLEPQALGSGVGGRLITTEQLRGGAEKLNNLSGE